ncbi:hypothetical protein BGZ94_009986 [Podila epigama]|nr:hypothetical protein BGZ94_009986 [Podila epigama]
MDPNPAPTRTTPPQTATSAAPRPTASTPPGTRITVTTQSRPSASRRPNTTSLSSSTSSISGQPSPSATPIDSAASKGGLSTPAIAGIAAAAGVLLLFVISVICCRKRRALIYAKTKPRHDPSRDPINPLDVLPPFQKDPNTPDSEPVAISLAALESSGQLQANRGNISNNGHTSPSNDPHQRAIINNNNNNNNTGFGSDRDGSVSQSEHSYHGQSHYGHNGSPTHGQHYSPAMGPQVGYGRGPPGSGNSSPTSNLGPASPPIYPQQQQQRPPHSPPFPGPGPNHNHRHQYQPPHPPQSNGARSPRTGSSSPNYREPPNF